ncbi:hypothetical protein NL676_014596 [Syzygium grande]|nr:hypothetical protein NL676_014596 [Syzygium grande]
MYVRLKSPEVFDYVHTTRTIGTIGRSAPPLFLVAPRRFLKRSVFGRLLEPRVMRAAAGDSEFVRDGRVGWKPTGLNSRAVRGKYRIGRGYFVGVR